MNYFALAATVSASQDLFSSEWTEGNLYAINGIVEKLGGFACWVISIVGFGIVIFSILKNALSGLYVVNPNLWDRVDEIKTQAVAGAQGTIQQVTGNGNVASQKLGGILVFLLGLIPNVKQLTDFEKGAQVDKKQYFTHSLILLFAQVFIGMLIFFGYPAKIANWIGSGATYAVSAIINNVDPVQVVSGVSDKFTVYKLQTDGAQSNFEKNVNAMASKMVSTIATKYNDMKKDAVQDVAYDVESRLLSKLDNAEVKKVLDASDGYVYSITAGIQNSSLQVSSSYKQLEEGLYMATATNGTVSIKYGLNCNALLTSQHTTKLSADDTMVWTITATPVAISDISTSSLIIMTGSGGFQTTSKSSSIMLNGITIGNGSKDLHGVAGKVVTVEAYKKGTDDKHNDTSDMKTFNASLQTTSATVREGASLFLVFSEADKNTINNYPYLKVLLPSGFTMTATDNNSETTVRVGELRIIAGSGNKVNYALSSWSDVDDTTWYIKKNSYNELTSKLIKASNATDAK